MYRYAISGGYFEEDTRRYFYEEVEATNNVDAIKIVLGDIAWKASLEGQRVMIDTVHYEVLKERN